MTSNPLLCAALALALAGSAHGQSAKAGQRLTEGQLQQQIESFNPRSGDPLEKAPASVTETARVQTTDPARRVAATSALPAAGEEAKPKKPKGETIITADAVDFDQKARQAIFVDHVTVKDPEFDLVCDKLTAFLKGDKTAATANGTKPGATPAPKPKSGGLEKAIAEGNVVITQDKLDADGTVTKSIGKSARADYNAATGEMMLSGNPEVQQGINTCVATDSSTRMFMKREGRMRVEGPSRMIIRDQGETK